MLWTSVTRWFKVSVCLAQRLACSGRWLFIVFPCTGPHLLVSLSVLQTFVEDWTQCGTVWQLWESADFVESPVRFLCLRNCRDVLASAWRAQVCGQALPAVPPEGSHHRSRLCPPWGSLASGSAAVSASVTWPPVCLGLHRRFAAGAHHSSVTSF